MKVILNPSGSLTANAQSPQGVSDGSRSSVQPFALTRPASSLMSCAVETHSRNPSPFLRSRPLAKSSWPSMMSQAPAFICIPRSPPFVSQRSPGVNPSTSRYQATLFWRSFTVNDAAMERSRNDSGCWRGGRLGRAGRRSSADGAGKRGMGDGAPAITEVGVKGAGKGAGLDQAGFQKAAEEAKTGCPVSRALKGIAQITLAAQLE